MRPLARLGHAVQIVVDLAIQRGRLVLDASIRLGVDGLDAWHGGFLLFGTGVCSSDRLYTAVVARFSTSATPATQGSSIIVS